MKPSDADRQILKRINRLIEDVLRDPYEGIGKPEPLKHALAGAWSRRITDEHRLAYLPDGDASSKRGISISRAI